MKDKGKNKMLGVVSVMGRVVNQTLSKKQAAAGGIMNGPFRFSPEICAWVLLIKSALGQFAEVVLSGPMCSEWVQTGVRNPDAGFGPRNPDECQNLPLPGIGQYIKATGLGMDKWVVLEKAQSEELRSGVFRKSVEIDDPAYLKVADRGYVPYATPSAAPAAPKARSRSRARSV